MFKGETESLFLSINYIAMKHACILISLLIILLLSGNSLQAASMGQIVGRVLEKETGQPIAYAEITFESKMDKVTVTANEYGFYYADHLPTGKYQIQLQHNTRTFYINNVRVYDGYTSEIPITLSSDNSLPQQVQLAAPENITSSVVTNDVKLTASNNNQATRSINDVLSTQPGIDIRGGEIFIKGSNQVRFFIDGSPVMGPPARDRVW